MRRRGLLCLLGALLGGCAGQDATTPLVPDPARVYAALRLNYKAAVISLHAPYNTVDLQAIPINLRGDPIVTTERPIFSRVNALDTTVRVDSLGHVTAQAGTSGTRVMVQQRIGMVTRYDTVTIMVRTETPVVPITRLEFSPVAPDSNWRWAGESTFINTQSWIRLFNEHGDPIPVNQALVHVWPKHREVFDFMTGVAMVEYPYSTQLVGETYVYAQLYAYDRVLIDSTPFRRIDPPLRLIVVDRVVPANGESYLIFFPSTIVAKAGTTVAFMNRFGTDARPRSGPSAAASAWYLGMNRIPLTRDVPDTLPNGNVSIRQITWVDSIDINFDGPAPVEAGQAYGAFLLNGFFFGPIIPSGAGNIPAFSVVYCGLGLSFCGGRPATGGMIDEGIRYRKFTVPGTYRLSSTRFPGVSGTIIITE